MNVALHNDLVNAYNFFVQDERNRNAVASCERKVRLCILEYGEHIQPFRKEKMSWLLFFVLLWLFFPAAFIYVAAHHSKNQKRQEEHERRNQQILNSPEEIAYRRKKMEEREEAQAALAQAIQVQETYYRNNYDPCLSFLPQHLRHKESVEALLHFVKTGQAQTLDEARNCYGAELRELDEMRERWEEEKAQERRHRETQDALRSNAENQERIIRELEILNKKRRY